MPLSFVKSGDIVKLKAINCGFKLKKRLQDMGITQDLEFKVVNNTNGPLIIEIRGSKIALGRGEAQKIIVDVQ